MMDNTVIILMTHFLSSTCQVIILSTLWSMARGFKNDWLDIHKPYSVFSQSLEDESSSAYFLTFPLPTVPALCCPEDEPLTSLTCQWLSCSMLRLKTKITQKVLQQNWVVMLWQGLIFWSQVTSLELLYRFLQIPKIYRNTSVFKIDLLFK